jgi:hypothetical protein
LSHLATKLHARFGTNDNDLRIVTLEAHSLQDSINLEFSDIKAWEKLHMESTLRSQELKKVHFTLYVEATIGAPYPSSVNCSLHLFLQVLSF